MTRSSCKITFRKLVLVVGAWLVLIPVAVLSPSSFADAAVLDTPQAVFEPGMRTSRTSDAPASALAFNDDFRPCLLDNTCPEQGGGGDDGELATPTPTPTPIPRDPVADAIASRDEALVELHKQWEDPHWVIFPHHERQVVGLDSFLHIVDKWDDHSEAGPLVGEQQVTVDATAVASVWEFTEETTGRKFTIRCDGPGEPWTQNDTEPSCGKKWDHSSDVVGLVQLDVAIEFEITWSHTHTSGTETHLEWSTQKPKLTVLEVLAFGISEGFEFAVGGDREPEIFRPDDGVKCGWGAHIAATPFPGVGCEAFQLIWDVFTGFLGGCIGAVIGRITEFWDLVKDVSGDPIGFVKDKVAGLKAMYDLALSDPLKLLNDMGREALEIPVDADLSTWGQDEWSDWAGGFICGQAFDYITGKAVDKVFEYLDGRIRGDNDGDGSDGSDGSDGDDDSSTGDDDDTTDSDDDDTTDSDDDDTTEDDDGPVVCPSQASSFPGETLVLMEDGSHRPIRDIRPGDRVLSFNTDTSVWEPKLVLDQWSHVDRGPPATAVLADGSTVTATDDHLFYVPTSQVWVELQDLTPAVPLLSPEGLVDIAAVTVGSPMTWTVWELTVEGNHNFTVSTGTTDVLVHNQDGVDVTGTSPADIQANWENFTGGRAEWFDNLSIEQVQAIIDLPGGANAPDINNTLKNRLAGGLRGSGGMHEFFPVSQAAEAKRLGLTAEDIHNLSVPTGEFLGTYPETLADGITPHPKAGEPFVHHFDEYHKELFDAIQNADTAQEALEAIDAVNKRHNVGTIDLTDPDVQDILGDRKISELSTEELQQLIDDGLLTPYDEALDRDWTDREYEEPDPDRPCDS